MNANIHHSKIPINSASDRLSILFQDQNIVVIFKPSGLLSVPFQGNKGRSAQSILEEMMRKNGTWRNNHKPYAVHRLDKETSGVMMFALTEKAKTIIMDTWHKMVINRLYHAIAENPKNPKDSLPDSGIIDKPLAQNAQYRSYVPKGDAKVLTTPARTNYKILKRGKYYSLFELNLDTGKKNQIRAHLANENYPLAGDANYRARTNPLNRLALHARTLEFVHPFTQEKMIFEVPESPEWDKIVK